MLAVAANWNPPWHAFFVLLGFILLVEILLAVGSGVARGLIGGLRYRWSQRRR